MLTPEQMRAAHELREQRPRTFDGSNVIVSDEEREAWHGKVNHALDSWEVRPEDVQRFCDIAGVL